MIAALYALSAAMVIGGSAAVVQGFPYVRLESGLAMVIAGAVTAASGMVLFGLGVVAAGLKRVERAFDTRRIVEAAATAQEFGRSDPALAPSPELGRISDAAPPVLAPEPASTRPVLPTLGVLGGAGAALAGRPQAEPTFDDALFEADPLETPSPRDRPHPILTRPDPAPEIPSHEAPSFKTDLSEPELPLPGLTPVAAPDPVPEEPVDPPEPSPAGIAPEDDLFASPASPPADRETEADALALRPSLDDDRKPGSPEPEAVEPEAGGAGMGESETAKPEVVGRHSSGGNTYVMFADGSIEAETPQGRFTFGSLDELKAFVNAGGEGGTRGAA